MKIAIVGYDVEGKASYEYYNQPGNDLYVFDESDQSIGTSSEGDSETGNFIYGAEALRTLRKMSFDLVLRTPGLSPGKLKGIVNVSSATREFFDASPAPIIGVTGTKGKGTTASLIAAILSASGKRVHLVGNIGTPALSVLSQIKADDVVVYEMSSFQLWDMDVSPYIAVVLMIEPDHLDRHSSLDEYLVAKANIVKYQGVDDIAIYHPTNLFTKEVLAVNDRPAKIRYDIKEDGGVYHKENTFFVRNHPICSTEQLQLIGEHNIENAAAAITACRAFSPTIADEVIAEGLSAFHGLDHRLKLVAEMGGVRYFDDSISTTPGSTIAAIQSFQEPKVLILGGSDKGIDFSPMISAISEQNIRSIILIGDQRDVLKKLLIDANISALQLIARTASMVEIVEAAVHAAQPGDVVILSPACASFDMFKSYKDRGDQFISAVKAL